MTPDEADQNESRDPRSPDVDKNQLVNLSPDTEELITAFGQAIDQIGRTGESEVYTAPVKALPKHGVFFRWPQQGIESFVHPQDVDLALQVIPGSRIFKLQRCPNESDHAAGYALLSYGDLSIRIQPAMWLRVDEEGYRVGDRVEVLSKNGKKDPVIGDLTAVTYNPVARKIEYKMAVNGMELPKKFHKEDFRPCRRLGVPLGQREKEMLGRVNVSF